MIRRFLSNSRSSVGPDLFHKKLVDIPKRPRRKFSSPERVGDDLLFGLHPVKAALAVKRRKFYNLLMNENTPRDKAKEASVNIIKQLSREAGVELKIVQKSQLDRLVGNSAWNPHQGVVLQCDSLPTLTVKGETEFPLLFQSQSDGRVAVIPILVNIVDPMNIGAIMRSAYFFGCRHMILTNDCGKLSGVVSKASSGAMEALDVAEIPSKLLSPYIRWISSTTNRNEFCSVATTALFNDDHQSGEKDKIQSLSEFYSQFSGMSNLLPRIYLILGNEGNGLPRNIVDQSDYQITIPAVKNSKFSEATLNSLNVSVTAGVFLATLTNLFKK